jgi:hypothetical protein
MKYGQVLGKGSGDAIQGTELTDTIGRAQGAESLDASVAIGGIRGIELIATADPAQLSAIANGVIHCEGIVARYAEDVANPKIMETRQDMLDNGVIHKWYLVLRVF